MATVSGEVLSDSVIGFREMGRDDFSMLRTWLEGDAVREWWHEPTDLTSIEKKYGPNVDGKSPTKSFITLVAGVPVEMMQVYRTKGYPEYSDAVGIDNAVAFDWFIGNQAYFGKGLGKDIALRFSSDVIAAYFPDCEFVVASPSVKNARSIHVLAKAGFEDRVIINVPSEDDPEELMVLACTK